MKTKHYALVGMANVGKTTLFNALTGSVGGTGNYSGVTVEQKNGRLKNSDILITDLPGMYDSDAFSEEEKTTRDFLKNKQASIICVFECARFFSEGITYLKNLAALKKDVILVLTFKSEFERLGGRADEKKASTVLGIPVFVLDGTDKKAVKRLAEALISGKGSPLLPFDEKQLLAAFIKASEQKISFLDKIFLSPFLSPLAFIALVGLIFYIAFAENGIGDFSSKCITAFFDLLQESVSPPIAKAVISGVGGVICFLPQLVILYSALLFLEEFGFLPRFAFVSDGLMKRVGLSGRAVLSILLGFGCTAAAMLSTRGMTEKTAKRKAVCILPFIPCSARMPVYMVIINRYFLYAKVPILILLYLSGIILGFIVATFTQKTEQKEPFIMEIPPYRFPKPRIFLRSLWDYVLQFLIKIGTVVLLVTLAVYFLSSYGFDLRPTQIDRSILAFFGKALAFIFYPIGIDDWRIAVSALCGLFAKEAVASSLASFFPEGLMLAPTSALALLFFFALYTPCLAGISAMKKEVGGKLAAIFAVLQFIIAIFIAYVIYLYISICAQVGYGAVTTVIIITIIILILSGKKRCNFCRGKTYCKGKCQKSH